MAATGTQSKSELPDGEVVVLTTLLGYQEGAVVSRTLVKRATGTVTLFVFDEDQGLSEHTAAFDALVQVLDGQAEVAIAGKPFLVKAGEALLLPASQPHAVRAVTRFKMLLTMIRS
ncbi:MAG: cupin domain-containing protein [Candidatus Acidiferrum sp.]